MPYILDSYERTFPREATVAWKVVKNHMGTVQTDYILKSASDAFFADLKTTLTKTGLDITFTPATYKLTIWGHDLYVPVTPIHYSTTLNDTQTGIPRCHMDGFYDLHRTLIGMYIRACTASSYWGSGNAMHIRLNILDNIFSKNSMHYKIMVYYKENYLLVQYLTPQNYVCPLFCVIKGTLKNSDSVVTYVSANPNLHFHDPAVLYNNANTVYGSSTRDIIPYRDYDSTVLPGSHTIFVDGNPLFYYSVDATHQYIGQDGMGIYFHSERPDRLDFDLRTLQNVEKYYIKPVKLFNDQIDFPNLYYGDEKMEFDKFYNINNADYYCPGDVGVDANAGCRIQCGWPKFLLKL